MFSRRTILGFFGIAPVASLAAKLPAVAGETRSVVAEHFDGPLRAACFNHSGVLLAKCDARLVRGFGSVGVQFTVPFTATVHEVVVSREGLDLCRYFGNHAIVAGDDFCLVLA